MRYSYIKFALIMLCTILSCKQNAETNTEIISEKHKKQMENDSSRIIINASYNSTGVSKLQNADIEFTFRDKIYLAKREDGKFQLERQFEDSIGVIRDVLSNHAFERYIDDVRIAIPDSMANKYKESVNSVHYFSALPFGLKDEAVNSEFLGSEKINNKDYYKVKVGFSEQGGGQDFEDEFIYWINKNTKYIDYLAYSFTVNGGGMRFREAYNSRMINGVRIVDYKNYKPVKPESNLADLGAQFQQNELELLSNIVLEDVKIILPSEAQQ